MSLASSSKFRTVSDYSRELGREDSVNRNSLKTQDHLRFNLIII